MKYFKDVNKELTEMLKSAVHFGHYTNKWNPKCKKYIYGSRSGVHVFDLHKTIKLFDEALDFLNTQYKSGNSILLVSTKQQAIPVMTATAKELSLPFVTYKWIPGLITNYGTVSKQIAELKKLRQMREDGGFAGYTKKEISKFDKKINRLEQTLGGVEFLEKPPACLFVLDIVRDNIAVTEARKKGIPIVGLVDSNADPDLVDYPIPANDDALKSITYVMDKIVSVLNTK